MHILIDVSDKEVPRKQDIINISLHFIDGEVCECSYPYIVLPKGHTLAKHGLIEEQEFILDKIRAEIESKREEASNKHSEDKELLSYYFGLNDGLKDARDILDKYIAESEG